MRFLWAIYTVWYWTIGFLWMGLVVVPGAILARLLSPSGKLQYQLANVPMGFMPRLNFVRYRVIRHPRYDEHRPSVFVQNHVNLFDPHTACAALPVAFAGLMNWWHFRVPVYGWLMWLTHGIPVASSPLQRARELPGYFRDRAAMGFSVLTFPEAHRTMDGKVHEFKRGVTQLARDAGLPLVPVAVRGMYEVMRKGSLLVRPGKTVEVWIGPQFETEGLGTKEMIRLTRELEEMVRHFVETGEPPKLAAPADGNTG